MLNLFSSAKDRRHSPRVQMRLSGRGLLPDRSEFAFQVADLSGSGLLATTSAQVPICTGLVVYLDQIGRLEGDVVRKTSSGFAMSFRITARKQAQIEADIARLTRR
jgi:hypothetical protein